MEDIEDVFEWCADQCDALREFFFPTPETPEEKRARSAAAMRDARRDVDRQLIGNERRYKETRAKARSATQRGDEHEKRHLVHTLVQIEKQAFLLRKEQTRLEETQAQVTRIHNEATAQKALVGAMADTVAHPLERQYVRGVTHAFVRQKMENAELRDEMREALESEEEEEDEVSAETEARMEELTMQLEAETADVDFGKVGFALSLFPAVPPHSLRAVTNLSKVPLPRGTGLVTDPALAKDRRSLRRHNDEAARDLQQFLAVEMKK